MTDLVLTQRRSLPPAARANGVTAVLGPTNTGKTHLAIERMVAHPTGMIGLPLRLLAREVYNRIVERMGAHTVALVTGEEKIKPPRPRFWVSTIEAMPRDIVTDFVAIDEIQLAASLDRGHVFTDRLLNQRGRAETLLIGAATMQPIVEQLIPGISIASRPRLSNLMFAGDRKLTRLPPRTAIVAFSAEEVYAIAELIRRQKGGAAVVMGALSPRTRNAQVELFQSGDVDYLIATDAIGMGLNLDVNHVAFAADFKFDGHQYRKLNPAEFGQIAGRAGRHLRDGTFGTSGRCSPFDADLVESIENHRFEPVRMLQWRNTDLAFESVAALQESLSLIPTEPGLTRAPIADDEASLETLLRDGEIRTLACGRGAVTRLWEACQLPDYRKIAPAQHNDLISTLYRALMTKGHVDPVWFSGQVQGLDRTDGDIDTLSARIAQVRTWTFVANRPDWLPDPEHWQGVARLVEDKLSDALHERLAARFVDRRTSVLMRRLREKTMLEAEVNATGDVLVEGQHVGMLQGFRFTPDVRAAGPEARALNAAAAKALASEIEARAARLSLAGDEALVLSNDGAIRWIGEPIARLSPSEKMLAPQVRLLAEEHLTGPARDQVEARVALWLKAHVTKLLGPVQMLEDAPDITGIARGIAFQIAESLGVLERARVAEDMKTLDQEQRATLRKHGVRFGAFHLYLPALLKPAPRALASQLWALKHGGAELKGLTEIAHLASSGRTSIPVDKDIQKGLYRAGGYRVCGERAVRVDILERLADLIRPAVTYRPGTTPGEPPVGSADGDGFVVTGAMTSLVGCSGEDFSGILRSLGYVSNRRPGPAITVALVPLASTAPVVVKPTEPQDLAEVSKAEAFEVAEGAGSAAAEVAAEPEKIEAAPAVELLAIEPVAAETVAEGENERAEPIANPMPADATLADATPSDAALAEVAPAEVAPAEAAPVAEIEVWRPHRQQGGGRRPEQNRGPRRDRGGRSSAAGAAEGAPAADGEKKEGERQERRPHFRRPERTADGQKREGQPGEQQPRREGGRPEGGRAEGQRRDGPRDARPQGPRDGQRGDSRGERRPRPEGDRGQRRPEKAGSWQSEPARKPREADPDSPFAKLLALKAQLEGGSKS